MGIRDRLLRRQDWSDRPNAWVSHAALAVAWLLLAVFVVESGDRSGFGLLIPATIAGLVAVHAFRAARAEPRSPDTMAEPA